MPRSIVKSKAFSLRRTSPGRRLGTVWVLLVGFCLAMQAATQYIAWSLDFHSALGPPLLQVAGCPIYPFYRGMYWLRLLLGDPASAERNVTRMGMLIFAGGCLVSIFLARLCRGRRRNAAEVLHGSAHWASTKEVVAAGLLSENKKPLDEGVVVGGIVVGGLLKKTLMLRHNGKEHVLCFAPTRSGKGISLVLPTLLDGWRQSAFILDIKGENFALTSGYRKRELGHKILRLDFTDPTALEEHTGATFNPLEEVLPDFRFRDGVPPDLERERTFELIPSGTYVETATIQQIVSIVVDPHGKGLEDHWAKTASSLMLGCITHLLYKFRLEGRGCPGMADVLSELSRPGEEWQDVVQAWQSYPHLGIRAISDRNGEEKLIPLVHPIVAEEAQTILSKPAKEAGSVLSTVVSNLALFRDPVIARNTGRSSFRIRDLMHNDSPVSLYLIVNPNDQLRLTPLTRLIITQIVFNLAQKMDFRDGRSVEGYRHRLLLLLDEFPSLGRMELFERALGFIGGYGLKAYIIVQDLSQLYKAYTKEESIRAGCHIQVAFAPNTQETAEYLSRMLGQVTVPVKRYSESVTQGKRTVSVSLHEEKRALLDDQECRSIPGLKKNRDGDVTEPGDMLILPTGFPPIYGRQTPYFMDAEMDRRSRIPAPEKSDVLL
nr:type IV secretory system conjugative DNA transfer family protein [uncultured Fretibacterium sp.]